MHNSDGIVDALLDGQNGKLIPAKDPQALADAICNFYPTEPCESNMAVRHVKPS